MNNVMQEALKKAGVNAEDFKKNENLRFSRFPIITKWRPILPENEVMEKFRYKQGPKSATLQSWMEKQNKGIIGFLRKNKDRVYILPSNDCQKYCECWIAYNTEYQRFTIRMNRLAYTIRPWTTPTNSYASYLAKTVCDMYNLNLESKEVKESIDFKDIINRLLNDDKIPEVIRKTFTGQTMIPVEYFDPIVEINSLVSGKMVVVENTNLDLIRKQLAEMQDILDGVKLHKNVIDLYCSFNNIKVIDPCGVSDTTDWMNLIFAKDVNGNKKKDKSFFIVI